MLPLTFQLALILVVTLLSWTCE